MEINKSGLKFLKLRDNQLLVETGNETKANDFNEPDISHKLLSHNFQQLENFCHSHGKENYENENKNSCFRFYTVIENFSDENVHYPGVKSSSYNIYQNTVPDISFLFNFFVNEKVSENEKKRFINIDLSFLIMMIFIYKYFVKFVEYISCSISLVDNQGKDRFTQNILISAPVLSDFINVEPIYTFMRRDEVLDHASELLHSDHLILYIKLDLPNNCKEISDSFSTILIHFKEMFTDSFFGNSNYVQVIMEMIEDIKRKKTQVPVFEFADGFSCLDIVDSLKGILNVTDDKLAASDNKYDGIIDASINIVKKCFNMANNVSINDFNAIFDHAKIKEQKEKFLTDFNAHSKFFCSSDLLQIHKRKGFQFKHIHFASCEYLECKNPIIVDENCIPLHSNFDEIERNLNFSSAFYINDKGEQILLLDSDFGKTLCELSNFFKNMLKYPFVETLTQKATIQKNDFEALKNIYRLSKGTRYIKADTIHDIISLYKASDFYDIPILMEFCRKLFEKHICLSNASSIKELCKICYHDDDLNNIVRSFETEMLKISAILPNQKISLKISEDSLYILKNDDVEDIQYDFYK